MKHNKMILIGFVLSAVSYAMEQPLALSTKVKIKKGSLYDADGTVDILVVGLREQRRLNRTFFMVDKKGYEIKGVGAVQLKMPHLQFVNIMKKEDDSDSIEETEHHPCKITKNKDSNFYRKEMESKILVVVEPELDNLWYGNKRENYEYINGQGRFCGEEAIEIAGLDLCKCYQNILEEGLKELGNKQHKSIAIPTLSTSTFFPRRDAAKYACESIMNFIQKYPGAYSCIKLYVKKRFEYVTYCDFFKMCQLLKESSEQDSTMDEEINV